MLSGTRRGLAFIINIIAGILAFVTIIMILLLYINGSFRFLSDENTMMLTVLREVAIISVVGLKGMEFALKRGLIVTIIFAAILLAVIVFMFFPSSLPSWIA